MAGQGYSFKGAKAKQLQAVLAKAKLSPDYARQLLGLKPKKKTKP